MLVTIANREDPDQTASCNKNSVMTTCYITLSAGTGNVMTTSITIMQIFIEINTL